MVEGIEGWMERPETEVREPDYESFYATVVAEGIPTNGSGWRETKQRILESHIPRFFQDGAQPLRGYSDSQVDVVYRKVLKTAKMELKIS
ncbi:MAG: hypothetical protein ABIH92_00740 [Nanoarchaeota archaeon]